MGVVRLALPVQWAGSEIRAPMPNPETTSTAGHVPFRTCIRLEDVSEARTSAIDAEWESLSAVEAPECALPTALARARFETLPGLGPESEPAAAKPRLSQRSSSLGSTLAATLAISLALAAVLVLRVCPGIFARLAASARPSLLVATSKPAPSLRSVPSEPLLSHSAVSAEARIPESKVEPPPTKPARNNKPRRSIPAAPGWAAMRPAPQWVPSRGRDARQGGRDAPQSELASSDNPY